MSIDVPFGAPVPRIDGRAKVTGSARYAAEHVHVDLAHARLVTSRIAHGRIASIDTSAAEKAGAKLILTHLNADRLPPIEAAFPFGQAQTKFLPMQSDEIRYAGQPVALVVADTVELAEYAASMVDVEYESAAHQTDLSDQLDRARAFEGVPEIVRGDVEAAFAVAPAIVQATYETAVQHHNAMERFSTTVAWQGNRLIVYEPSQWLTGMRAYLAERFAIEQDQVRVISPFVGGAFGSKALAMPHTAMTAIAARRLERPVKLVVSREQMFTVGGFRPASVSHVRLAASSEGKLQAYSHDYYMSSSRTDLSPMPGVEAPNVLYDMPNARGRDRFVDLDLNQPGPMRAPQEMPSVFALECAMDELAHELKIDPLELRLRNDAGERDPITGLPFSSRSLAQCFTRGAEMIDWSRRSLAPRAIRDGDWLVGLGCGASIYPVFISPTSVLLRMSDDGTALVQSAGQDIGTGLYTVIAAAAAEILGIAVEQVRVELGDSDLPFGSMAGGSRSTASVVPAVRVAATRVRDQLLRHASESGGAFVGRDPDSLTIVDGSVRSTVVGDNTCELVVGILKRLSGGFIEEKYDFAPSGLTASMLSAAYAGGPVGIGPAVEKKWAMYSFGAQFVQVHVHRHTGVIRVPRAVGVFGAGRIANERTAHSQLMGGMIWGLSSGLLEATHIDHRYGRYLNANLAEYPIPVCADIGTIEIEMLKEVDQASDVNPSGMKGVGELAVVGTGAAISNAVFNATGKRVRHLPITIEDVLDAL